MHWGGENLRGLNEGGYTIQLGICASWVETNICIVRETQGSLLGV